MAAIADFHLFRGSAFRSRLSWIHACPFGFSSVAISGRGRRVGAVAATTAASRNQYTPRVSSALHRRRSSASRIVLVRSRINMVIFYFSGWSPLNASLSLPSPTQPLPPPSCPFFQRGLLEDQVKSASPPQTNEKWKNERARTARMNGAAEAARRKNERSSGERRRKSKYSSYVFPVIFILPRCEIFHFYDCRHDAGRDDKLKREIFIFGEQ